MYYILFIPNGNILKEGYNFIPKTFTSIEEAEIEIDQIIKTINSVHKSNVSRELFEIIEVK